MTMTPKERIFCKQTTCENEIKKQFTQTRTAHFDNLRGTVRICKQYNEHWRDFTLQRGHFFGQDYDGDFFVSAYEPGKHPNTIIVYAKAEFNGVWERLELPIENDLCVRIKAALKVRESMGIKRVEHQPRYLQIKHERVPFPKGKPKY